MVTNDPGKLLYQDSKDYHKKIKKKRTAASLIIGTIILPILVLSIIIFPYMIIIGLDNYYLIPFVIFTFVLLCTLILSVYGFYKYAKSGNDFVEVYEKGIYVNEFFIPFRRIVSTEFVKDRGYWTYSIYTKKNKFKISSYGFDSSSYPAENTKTIYKICEGRRPDTKKK